jgi:hypothetical protein
MKNQHVLEDKIWNWRQFGQGDEKKPGMLCDAINRYLYAKQQDPRIDFSFFAGNEQELQDDLDFILRHMGFGQLPGMVDQMKEYGSLLEASKVTGSFAHHIRERANFQSGYGRTRVADYLKSNFGCRLGEKTIPDGSCGFHTIAMTTGDSPVEVRRRCAWAAQDVSVYMRTKDTRQLSWQDPAYINRVVQAAEQRLLNEEDLVIAFGTPPGDRVEYLALEEEEIPKGKTPEDYWLKTEDLQFVSVVYGRPSIFVVNPQILREGMAPIEYYFDENGVRQLLWGNMAQAYDILNAPGAIGLMNLGRQGWEHWEPIVQLPAHLKPPKPAPVPEVRSEQTVQSLRQERDDRRDQMESLRGQHLNQGGHAFVLPSEPVQWRHQLPSFHRVQMPADSDYKPDLKSFGPERPRDPAVIKAAVEVRRKEVVEQEDVGVVATDKPMIQGQLSGHYPAKSTVGLPLDPNLGCPKCKVQFAIGQIQYLRKHVNDYGDKKD